MKITRFLLQLENNIMAHNGCCHLTALLFTTFVNIFDLITDWSFYIGEVSIKDGLVFGPYEPYIVTLLVFCVIASVTCVLEVALDYLNYNKKSKTVELVVDILAVTTLLIEDLPLIGINLHIALCREEATNVIQIAKASTAIFEASVKLCIMGIHFFRNKCKKTNKIKKAKKLRKALKICIVFLLAINLILSIIVFSITINFQKSHIEFDSPGLDREVSNRYLQGVGVFMRLPNIPNMAENQWMMLTDLKNITLLSSPTYGMFLSVLITTAPFQYIRVRKHFPGPPESISCYKRQSTSMILLPPNSCSNLTSSANTTTVSLRFTYVRPSNFQPMGDIHYNTELRQEFHQILTNETVY
ncbi:uncharacterized protein LOC117333406 isoform X1 [Pecten maximus]|uniref:uncharacterized protein LOC117333406 isoform X1 n=2 Tax=Pecten maximus TaxID=6579 RepID=UPI0014585AD6|nr:uncharacterized protein LOC117333406 isoform X1 [Pecten maximus]